MQKCVCLKKGNAIAMLRRKNNIFRRQAYTKLFIVALLLCKLCFGSPVTIPPAPVPLQPSSSSPPYAVNFSLQQDSMLGVVGQLKSFLSLDDEHALAAEVDAGPRVWRVNGTYGFALSDNHRLKLTAEYLREALDFNFYTGDTRQWVDQGAIGASYQYLLANDIFKSVAVGSHYSHAPSKNLSDKTIVYADGSTLTDYRRIAGGDDWNGTAETALHLWPKSMLTVGADYDQVRYDTEYCTQEGQDAQGLGGHIRLQQLLKTNTQLEAESTVSQLYNSYGASLNWLWASTTKTTLSTGLNSSYTQDHTTLRNFWISGINLNVVWDPPQNKQEKQEKAQYAEPQVAAEDLTTWVQTPAVRMPDVLAISDECVVKTGKTGTCPSNFQVQYNTTTHTYSAPGGWYQYYPTPLSTPTEALWLAFDSANVTGTPSGVISCLYGIDEKNLILRNNAFQNAAGTGTRWVNNRPSNYWPNPPEPDPNSSCPAQTAACPFQTVSP